MWWVSNFGRYFLVEALSPPQHIQECHCKATKGHGVPRASQFSHPSRDVGEQAACREISGKMGSLSGKVNDLSLFINVLLFLKMALLSVMCDWNEAEGGQLHSDIGHYLYNQVLLPF